MFSSFSTIKPNHKNFMNKGFNDLIGSVVDAKLAKIIYIVKWKE